MTMSSYVIADVVEILESTGRWSADRSGSIRAVRSKDGWSELALFIGADDRLHVVVSTVPGEDSDLALGEGEVRVELVLDVSLGALRVAETLAVVCGLA